MSNKLISVEEHINKLEDLTLQLMIFDLTHPSNIAKKYRSTFVGALQSCFLFSNTPQGGEFWIAITRTSRRMENSPCYDVYKQLTYKDHEIYTRKT